MQTALAESVSQVFFIFCKGCLEQSKYVGNTKLQLNSVFCCSVCLFCLEKVIYCQPSQWLHAGAEWCLKALQVLLLVIILIYPDKMISIGFLGALSV